MNLVRLFAAAALTCASLAASGGVADAQQYRHRDTDGTNCISGPNIVYDPASQYYTAVFHNACDFAIRIDFDRRDPRTGAMLSNYCWAHKSSEGGEGRCLLLLSDSLTWDEHP